MDIRSTRAHVCQILSTVAAVGRDLSLTLVLPKYHEAVDLEEIKKDQDLPRIPELVFLSNFGIKKSGIAAFALFNIPAMLFVLQKKFSKKIDFLYFRTSYFLPVAVLASILGIPFFYETHRRPVSPSERRRDHIMSKMATGIIVISSYMSEHYLSYGKKILVAHDAVSLSRFGITMSQNEARQKLELGVGRGLGAGDKICVYAGTISKLKGLDYVIAAAKILPEVNFLLVGFVSKEFINADFPPNVRLLGKVEQKELPTILRSADALLIPHPKGEYSQSPMKLFEYMATEVPIVASRLLPILEILNDKNSVLVEPEDEKALAEGIRRVISSVELSGALAAQALNDVQNHTWEKRGEAVEGFIKDALKK